VEGTKVMGSRRANVLVVEDEILISNLIAEFLNDSGFDVHAVPDAEGALKYLESGTAVDAVFTDINLLGEMDGSTLAQRVRERCPELPIVYCSGRFSPSAVQPLVSRSIFVRKPYDPADICTLLTRLTATQH
jgi:CheY-like chemotaxis protein